LSGRIGWRRGKFLKAKKRIYHKGSRGATEVTEKKKEEKRREEKRREEDPKRARCIVPLQRWPSLPRILIQGRRGTEVIQERRVDRLKPMLLGGWPI
jgi:hypothetical protein